MEIYADMFTVFFQARVITSNSSFQVCTCAHRETMVQPPHIMIKESFALAFRMKYRSFPGVSVMKDLPAVQEMQV